MEWLREQVDGGLAETDGADVGPGDEASRRLAAELRERARKGGEQPDLIGLDVPIDVYRELTDRVASREYRSVEDVLRRCLHLLERVEPTDEEKLEALRRDVRVGLDQFERGEYSPMDEAFARLNAPLDRSRSR
jgi:Arc/MetJ-type ribon-helix-helix transcriptional regulator